MNSSSALDAGQQADSADACSAQSVSSDITDDFTAEIDLQIKYQQFADLLLEGSLAKLKPSFFDEHFQINAHSQVRRALEKVATLEKCRVNCTSALHAAISAEVTQSAFWLVRQKADVCLKDDRGFTPLLLAAELGRLDFVTLLVKAGAKLTDTTHTAQSALHLAASANRRELIDYLVEMGISIDAVDNCGCSPLHIAVQFGMHTSVKALIAAGADVNLPSGKRGKLPLHFAAEADDEFLVKLLLQNQALPYKTDWLGIFPAYCTLSGKIQSLLENASSAISSKFRDFEKMVDSVDLSKTVKKELLALFFNSELMDVVHQIHLTRFDYSTAVIMEDWDKVDQYAADIADKMHQSYLLRLDHLLESKEPMGSAGEISNQSVRRSSLAWHRKAALDDNSETLLRCNKKLFYSHREIVAKVSLVYQHVNQRLSEIAVAAIRNQELLLQVRALISIRKILSSILAQEEIRDRLQLPSTRLAPQAEGEHADSPSSFDASVQSHFLAHEASVSGDEPPRKLARLAEDRSQLGRAGKRSAASPVEERKESIDDTANES